MAYPRNSRTTIGGCMQRPSNTILAGLIGLLAALLTGAGEFILHFDALARFGSEYKFFSGIATERSTTGHFIGVLGAPLYLIGCWHIYLMLKPASRAWAMTAFLIIAYGFVVGVVWIGSRASISALINLPPSPDIENLVRLYDLRYESLLQIIRLAVLTLSVIYIALVLTGRSHYPRWMAALNPITLLVASFVVYVISPAVGKYVMPIALNVAFFVFFAVSIMIAGKKGV